METIVEEIDKDVAGGLVTNDMVRKSRSLYNLFDLDQTLYYKVLQTHFSETIPVISVPTVAWTAKFFSRKLNRPKGMYVNFYDKDSI